jgi:hypothetical protein
MPEPRSASRCHTDMAVKYLKRHLAEKHDLAPNAHRAKWGLAAAHPIETPDYARRRGDLTKQLGLESGRRLGDKDTPDAVVCIDRVSLDALLLILGGFSNDYGSPRVEHWTAEEDARLIAYYRAHSHNNRLADGAMMELKLKFRNRTKAALYRRIYELRKACQLNPSAGYSQGSCVGFFEPPTTPPRGLARAHAVPLPPRDGDRHHKLDIIGESVEEREISRR